MLEIFRRFGLLIFLMAAIATFMQTTPFLIEVRPVDFLKEYQASDSKSSMTLDEYVTQKTEYKIDVQGAAWNSFFKRVNEVVSLRAPAGDWAKRLSVGWIAGQALYFTPEEQPLGGIQTLLAQINKKSLRCYLVLTGGEPGQYLSAFLREPSTMKESAQLALLYPYRPYSLWLALAGVVIYLLIPWPRRKPGAVAYPLTGRHVLMMDIGATLLTGLFFWFPFFVINSASRPSVFDSGWIGFTIFWWLLALLGIPLYITAALNAGLWIEILPDRLRAARLWKPGSYLFSEMIEYRPYAFDLPGWVRGLVWVLMILFIISRQPMSALAMKRFLQYETNGILITLIDGQEVALWDNDLPGFERITQTLESKGIRKSAQIV